MQNLTLDLTHFVHLRAQRVAQTLDLRAVKRIVISSFWIVFCARGTTSTCSLPFEARRILSNHSLIMANFSRPATLSASSSRWRGAGVVFFVFAFLAGIASLRRKPSASSALASIRPSTSSSIRISSFATRSAISRMSAIVVGHAEMAITMCFRPSSIRLAISISPSRVEQLDRAHFAHVHADRVGRAAEFGVDGGKRNFRFFFDFVVGRSGGRVVVQQQRFGVGRLLVDSHAHVVERADDAFDRLGLGEVVRQVIVDFSVREETALLAELDQRLQATFARLDVGRRQLARRHVGMLAITAFLRCRVLGTLAGELGGDFAGVRLRAAAAAAAAAAAVTAAAAPLAGGAAGAAAVAAPFLPQLSQVRRPGAAAVLPAIVLPVCLGAGPLAPAPLGLG